MFTTKKLRSLTLIAPVLAALTSPLAMPVNAAENIFNVRASFGQKQLDEDEWGDLDSQTSAGVLFDYRRSSWPVSLAADVFISGTDSDDSDSDIDYGYTLEHHVGVRKYLNPFGPSVDLYAGGGIALALAGLEQQQSAGGDEDRDNAVGGWVAVGLVWRASVNFNVGIDIRYSDAEVTVFDTDLNVGGSTLQMTVGYNW